MRNPRAESTYLKRAKQVDVAKFRPKTGSTQKISHGTKMIGDRKIANKYAGDTMCVSFNFAVRRVDQ